MSDEIELNVDWRICRHGRIRAKAETQEQQRADNYRRNFDDLPKAGHVSPPRLARP